MQKHKHKKPDFKPMQRRVVAHVAASSSKLKGAKQAINLTSFAAIGVINVVAGPDMYVKDAAFCLTAAATLAIYQQYMQEAGERAKKPNYLTCAIIMSSLMSNALSIASFVNSVLQDNPGLTPAGAGCLAFASFALSPAANFNGMLDEKPDVQVVKPEVYSALYLMAGASIVVGGMAENSPRLMAIGSLCIVNALTGQPSVKQSLSPRTLLAALDVMRKTPVRISKALARQADLALAG